MQTSNKHSHTSFMNKGFTLFIFMFMSLFVAAQSSIALNKKPNIIVILTDDMGFS